MAHELVYTSAEHGLKPRTHGFCTVAMTAGLSPNLVERLENISGYRAHYPAHDPQAGRNPVNYAHYRFTAGGRTYSVLSRVCFAGFDYTGRSNKLAHHVVVDADADPRPAAGPAAVSLAAGFHFREWTGPSRTINARRAVPAVAAAAGPANTWGRVAGDAGWAGALAAHAVAADAGPAVILYPPTLGPDDLLRMIHEALALVPPEQRWDVTYSTYLTDLPMGTTCLWRCMLPGSPEWEKVRRTKGLLKIDLTSGPIGAAPPGPLADAARAGTDPYRGRPTATAGVPAAGRSAGSPSGSLVGGPVAAEGAVLMAYEMPPDVSDLAAATAAAGRAPEPAVAAVPPRRPPIIWLVGGAAAATLALSVGVVWYMLRDAGPVGPETATDPRPPIGSATRQAPSPARDDGGGTRPPDPSTGPADTVVPPEHRKEAEHWANALADATAKSVQPAGKLKLGSSDALARLPPGATVVWAQVDKGPAKLDMPPPTSAAREPGTVAVPANVGAKKFRLVVVVTLPSGVDGRREFDVSVDDKKPTDRIIASATADNVKPDNVKPEKGKPEDVKPEKGKPEKGKPEKGKPEKPNVSTAPAATTPAAATAPASAPASDPATGPSPTLVPATPLAPVATTAPVATVAAPATSPSGGPALSIDIAPADVVPAEWLPTELLAAWAEQKAVGQVRITAGALAGNVKDLTAEIVPKIEGMSVIVEAGDGKVTLTFSHKNELTLATGKPLRIDLDVRAGKAAITPLVDLRPPASEPKPPPAPGPEAKSTASFGQAESKSVLLLAGCRVVLRKGNAEVATVTMQDLKGLGDEARAATLAATKAGSSAAEAKKEAVQAASEHRELEEGFRRNKQWLDQLNSVSDEKKGNAKWKEASAANSAERASLEAKRPAVEKRLAEAKGAREQKEAEAATLARRGQALAGVSKGLSQLLERARQGSAAQ